MSVSFVGSMRRLATLADERAAEYRAPYVVDAAEDGETAFTQSGSYQIYAMLKELSLLLNKLADEIVVAEAKGSNL